MTLPFFQRRITEIGTLVVSDEYSGAEYGARSEYSTNLAAVPFIYRYTLWRALSTVITKRFLACMLNPSTADHEILDPTVKGLVERAKQLNYDLVTIVNAYGFRATKPRTMFDAARAGEKIVGVNNDQILAREFERADLIFCGWGTNVEILRAAALLELLRPHRGKLHVLDLNDDGSPKHPLYVPHATQLLPWDPYP